MANETVQTLIIAILIIFIPVFTGIMAFKDGKQAGTEKQQKKYLNEACDYCCESKQKSSGCKNMCVTWWTSQKGWELGAVIGMCAPAFEK